MKNGTKPEKPSWEMLGELAGFIMKLLARILNHSQVEYWLGHKNELKQKLVDVFFVVDEYSDEYADIREDWKKFYKINFGWRVDFSRVIIPEMPVVGNWCLLFIAKGMTLNLAFKVCKNLFLSKMYCDDLDKEFTKNACDTSSHYAVWVLADAELDPQFLGKSVYEVDSEMKVGITLLERIIFEVKYFTETKKHLDVEGVTHCSGSRSSGGNVPSASWNLNSFRVGFCKLEYSSSDSGIRLAVRF